MGVRARTLPGARIRAFLTRTGKAEKRRRAPPAQVVVYYVIALALYMQSPYREVLRCLLGGSRWLGGPGRVPTDSAISQARRRLGPEPLKALHHEIVRPVARARTRGAWYKRSRLVRPDGSTLDVAGDPANAERYGRARGGPGPRAGQQLRMVSLVEAGTHVLFGARMSSYGTSEAALAPEVLARLEPGTLCLAGRGLFDRTMWCLARSTGADQLWRLKAGQAMPRRRHLPDGSYLSATGSSDARVIE